MPLTIVATAMALLGAYGGQAANTGTDGNSGGEGEAAAIRAPIRLNLEAPVPQAPEPPLSPGADDQSSPHPPGGVALEAAAAPPRPAASPPPPAAPVEPVSGAPTPYRLAVMPRFAYRLGDAARAVTPAPGFGVGGTVEVAYLRSRAGLEAALGVDFSYDRFSTSERGVEIVNGDSQTFSSTRLISETSFVLVHSAGVHLGRARPYFSVGAGIGIGYLNSAAAALRPGTANDIHALGRASVGIDVRMTDQWNLTLRADYTAVRATEPLVTETGARLPVFGDLLDLGAGAAFRF